MTASVAAKRRRLRVKMALGFTAAAAIAALALAYPYLEGRASADSADRFKAEPAAEPAQEDAGEGADPGDGIEWPSIDWEGLSGHNADVVGWISVPGTKVDYPLVQADAEWPEFYLSHGIDGETSRYGTPYVDCAMAEAGGVDAPLVVVYGHHLVNGEMFSDLAGYSDGAYAEEHAQILLMTPDGNRELRAVAADVVDAGRERWRTTFSDRGDFEAYAAGLVGGADVAIGDDAGDGRLYLLVTCSYGSANERTVVMARDASEDAPDLRFGQARFTALR